MFNTQCSLNKKINVKSIEAAKKNRKQQLNIDN